MAKGQLRGNKEAKKPKQPKAPPPVPAGFNLHQKTDSATKNK